MVGPSHTLVEMREYARGQGLSVQEMNIRGKVHNPENQDLAADLCALCDRTPSYQLPHASSLRVAVRSNSSAERLGNNISLTHEVINSILSSCCDWYGLLINVAEELKLSKRPTHLIVSFGLGDCVPMAPFFERQLQITKLEAQGIAFKAPPPQHRGSEERFEFHDSSIAIVGASCRLPGASDLSELWDLLAGNVDRHEELSNDRFDLRGSFRATQSSFVKDRKFFGNFIDSIQAFDNTFFGMNSKEAENMDPQQRILLELSYQALESSGYLRNHNRAAGDAVGCFIGDTLVEYLENTSAHGATAYTSTGTLRAFLCGRLSHYYGWSGPSEVVDTACSSSLVAINRACKSIQTGECNMALAGGVNFITGITNFLDLGKAGFLSPSGQCKPFDQAADGYCRSDGAGT